VEAFGARRKEPLARKTVNWEEGPRMDYDDQIANDPTDDELCAVDGCGLKARRSGYCHYHEKDSKEDSNEDD